MASRPLPRKDGKMLTCHLIGLWIYPTESMYGGRSWAMTETSTST